MKEMKTNHIFDIAQLEMTFCKRQREEFKSYVIQKDGFHSKIFQLNYFIIKSSVVVKFQKSVLLCIKYYYSPVFDSIRGHIVTRNKNNSAGVWTAAHRLVHSQYYFFLLLTLCIAQIC